MNKVQTMFRNGCIVAFGSAVAATPAFAAIDIAGIETSIESAKGNGETVAGWVVAAVAVIVGVSLILSMMRKA